MKTIKEAVDFLFTNQKQNSDYIKERVSNALENSNIDYKSLKVIHVAGTNGKGSTSNYINNILIKSGKTVGMFTSPFIVCMNDRIRINNEYISDEDFIRIISTYKEEMESSKMSFFEKLVFIAAVYFYESNVDYVIMEVGLGGRLDATNIFENIINIVTNISLDHTDLLGNTIEEIMEEKKGIIRNNAPVISSIDLGVDNIITSKHQGNNESFIYKGKEYSLKMIGEHQIENAKIAIEATNILNVSYEDIKEGLLESTWAGRLEVLSEEPYIIIDGAHNEASVKALNNAIKNKEEYTIVYSSISTKDINSVNLLKGFKEIIFTKFKHDKLVSPKDNFNVCTMQNKQIMDYREVLKNNNHKKILFTGSLYFISEVRNYILKNA